MRVTGRRLGKFNKCGDIDYAVHDFGQGHQGLRSGREAAGRALHRHGVIAIDPAAVLTKAEEAAEVLEPLARRQRPVGPRRPELPEHVDIEMLQDVVSAGVAEGQ